MLIRYDSFDKIVVTGLNFTPIVVLSCLDVIIMPCFRLSMDVSHVATCQYLRSRVARTAHHGIAGYRGEQGVSRPPGSPAHFLVDTVIQIWQLEPA